MQFAGKEVTLKEVQGTLKLLRYYREFLASDYERCHCPEFYFPTQYTKEHVRSRLKFLVNAAINRKAGIPDVACKKQRTDYQRALSQDCQELRDHRTRRRRLWGLNGRRFRTNLIQRRYGHMLEDA